MEAIIIVLLVVVLAAVGGVMFYFVREGQEARREGERERAQEARSTVAVIEALQRQVNALDSRITQSMNSVQRSVTESLSSGSQTLQQVTERLTGIDSAAKRILEEVGPGITALEDVLRPPTLRGSFGETLLQQLLANVLPAEHYELQYSFRNGQTVDAVIRIPEGLVPVDSKFPLEGFSRVLAAQSSDERDRERRAFVQAVKKHMDSVAKYILPDEETLPFALMYIPSESVYYEVMVRDEVSEDRGSLAEYARQKNIFPVSPNTFYALLEAVAKGLRGLQVEKQVKEIIDQLGRLQGDFQHIHRDFVTLGRHLDHARGKYDELDRHVSRFGERLARPLEAPELAELPSGADQLPAGEDEAQG